MLPFASVEIITRWIITAGCSWLRSVFSLCVSGKVEGFAGGIWERGRFHSAPRCPTSHKKLVKHTLGTPGHLRPALRQTSGVKSESTRCFWTPISDTRNWTTQRAVNTGHVKPLVTSLSLKKKQPTKKTLSSKPENELVFFSGLLVQIPHKASTLSGSSLHPPEPGFVFHHIKKLAHK